MAFLLQLGAERQLARAASNPHSLGVVSDDPVLSIHIPVAQIATGQLSVEDSALARGNVLDTVETAEDTNGLVLATEVDIQLGNLVGGGVACVGDCGCDGVQDVPQLRVTTWGTGRGKTRLG